MRVTRQNFGYFLSAVIALAMGSSGFAVYSFATPSAAPNYISLAFSACLIV